MHVASQPNRSVTASPIHPPPSLRRRAMFAAAASLLVGPQLVACAADAQAFEPQLQSLIDLSIVDRETGQPLTVYRKDGRSYVAGQPALRYALRISNRTGGRVLVVLSVDGVNVVSGSTAAVGQTGYVLDAWRTFDIAGWRKSDREIAAFAFAALADSYAARTGRPGNVGVVGMAAFLEKPSPPPPVTSEVPRPAAARSSIDASGASGSPGQRQQQEPAEPAAAAAMADTQADTAPAQRNGASIPPPRSAPSPEAKLGTAHGQRERSLTQRVRFERLSSTPQQRVEIAYDSLPNLVRAGIVALVPQATVPNAFPNDADACGFVPDPPPASH